ncbi:DUF2913 family protein [Shewanella aestuarii]|uniref:DUF2913 family protein n=1 Tax=Shewanella aestuarii TaxID=1028752 RepID=A0A6G9QRG6_9GAMM|nr:DUF2913 family protein [Shewanella aestuarii]QIR16391.1 DUF2913 family protein [Shewanella aestuarii]
MKPNYKQHVVDFCFNNLISLYIDVAEQRGFVPPQKRNAYLLKRLKNQYKEPVNKPIKKEIKTLIVRSKSINIEQQLIKLSALIVENNAVAEAEESWVDFLLRLQNHGFNLKVTSYDEPALPDCLYVIKDEIFNNIQRTGSPGPLGLYLYLNSVQAIENAIKLIKADTVFFISNKEIFDNHAKLLMDFRKVCS